MSPLSALAQTADFITDYQTKFFFEDMSSKTVIVEASIVNKVNSRRYYLPKSSNKDTFFIPYSEEIEESKEIIKNSLEVYRQKDSRWGSGQAVITTNYTIEEDPDSSSFIVKVPLSSDVETGQSHTTTIKYKTDSYIRKIGEIVQISFPTYGDAEEEQLALLETDKSTGNTTSINLTHQILINKSIDTVPKLSNETISVTENDQYNIYSLSNDQLYTRSNSYVMLGDRQFVRFKIRQDAIKSDKLTPEQISRFYSMLSTNIYKVAIPRDSTQISQQLLFKNISPEPRRHEITEDGNQTVHIETRANQTEAIEIEGSVDMQLNDFDTNIINGMSLEDYEKSIKADPSISVYLTGNSDYWQINDPEIRQITDSLREQSETVGDLIYKTYDYVTENLTYSHEKAKEKIPNERQGAYAVLFQNAPAVCMEYSDLATTLLRANGVATRTVMGYTLDENEFSYTDDGYRVGHEWLEAWIPGLGWLSIDPTWGSKHNRNIGYNLDRVIFYVTSDIQSKPTSLIGAYTADLGFEYGEYDIEIEAITAQEYYEGKDNLESLDDILERDQALLNNERYKKLTESGHKNTAEWLLYFEIMLKTSLVGRGILVSLPLCGLVVVLTTIVAIVKRIFSKKLARQ